MRTTLLAVAAALLLPAPSGAAVFRLVFEGSVGTVSDPDGALALGGISVASADRFRLEGEGEGAHGVPWSGAASIAGVVFADAYTSRVDDGGSLGDEFGFGSSAAFAVGTAGLVADFFRVSLVDGDGVALSSGAFPTEIDLADWSFTSLAIGGFHPDGPGGQATERFQILGSIDLVTLTEVPEPASLALLALGLLGIGAARRR